MAGVPEVVIAVMGITSAGKSSLIKQLTGQDIEIGYGLEACTKHVNPVRMQYGGANVTLLDTPGFNDLRDRFWRPLLDAGAVMTRHTGAAASAMALPNGLVGKSRVVLEIQREIVDEDKALIDTAAGAALNEELIALQRRHEAELRSVRDEFDEAVRTSNARSQAELAEVRRQLEEQVTSARRNQEHLREQDRTAARSKQQLETQLRIIQMNFANQREILEKEARARQEAHDADRKLWKDQMDAATKKANDEAANNMIWPAVADLANSAVTAFLMAMRDY